jgi:hypothetical protein
MRRACRHFWVLLCCSTAAALFAARDERRGDRGGPAACGPVRSALFHGGCRWRLASRWRLGPRGLRTGRMRRAGVPRSLQAGRRHSAEMCLRYAGAGLNERDSDERDSDERDSDEFDSDKHGSDNRNSDKRDSAHVRRWRREGALAARQAACHPKPPGSRRSAPPPTRRRRQEAPLSAPTPRVSALPHHDPTMLLAPACHVAPATTRTASPPPLPPPPGPRFAATPAHRFCHVGEGVAGTRLATRPATRPSGSACDPNAAQTRCAAPSEATA